MSGKIIKNIILLGLIVALAIFLFYFNSEPVTLRWANAEASKLELPLGVAILLFFFSGMLISGMIFALANARSSFGSWFSGRKIKHLKANEQTFANARELAACSRFKEARKLIDKIILSDPNHVQAALLAAETCLHQADDETSAGREAELRELALKYLDRARQDNPAHLELLLKSANLYNALGNHTAAYDNFHLALNRDPKNPYLLAALVEQAEFLERYEPALHYQQQLIRYASSNAEQQAGLSKLALLELKQAKKQFLNDPLKYQKEVEGILSRHREFVPALEELADIYLEQYRLEDAQQLLSKCYKLFPKLEFLKQLATLWIAVEQPERALASVKNLVQGKSQKILDSAGQLFLCSLSQELGLAEECKRELTLWRKHISETKVSGKPESEFESSLSNEQLVVEFIELCLNLQNSLGEKSGSVSLFYKSFQRLLQQVDREQQVFILPFRVLPLSEHSLAWGNEALKKLKPSEPPRLLSF